jgi:tRNA G18 (ribose-2'-O)-methylase SpoU
VPQIIPVADPMDPRIAAYHEVRERDLVSREGHFIAEGEIILKVLLSTERHDTESVLIAEKRLPKLEPLLASLPATTPVYVAGQKVLDHIVGFHLHRGIMALGRSAPALNVSQLLGGLKSRALVVALFGISNHDNVGGIFRNAAAFGADALILDAKCCDPLYRKAIRVSAGAVLTVPFARFQAGEDAVDVLTQHGFESIALSPGGNTPLMQLRRSPRIAVLLGTEGSGLPTEMLERIQTVCIPMADGFDSLNVATTSGIVLHHLTFMC